VVEMKHKSKPLLAFSMEIQTLPRRFNFEMKTLVNLRSKQKKEIEGFQSLISKCQPFPNSPFLGGLRATPKKTKARESFFLLFKKSISSLIGSNISRNPCFYTSKPITLTERPCQFKRLGDT